MKNAKDGACCCPCHKMTGILIAAFGLTFLLKNLGVYADSVNNMVWPCILIVLGLSKTCSTMCKCCSAASCAKD